MKLSLIETQPQSSPKLSLPGLRLAPGAALIFTFDYLDAEKKLERPERLARKDGNWPDLEITLF
jgi:hypothetical protein